MKNLKSTFAVLCMALLAVFFHVTARGQSADDKNRVATIIAGGSSVRWEVAAPSASLTLTVSAPDGQVFSKEFRGSSAEFRLSDAKGGFPDGQYTYELRVTPPISSEVKQTLAEARAKGNGDEVRRDLVKRGVLSDQPLVVSGGFTILNGSIIVAGLQEGTNRRVASVIGQPSSFRPSSGSPMSGLRRHHAVVNPFFDFVIADDLIVQGSACTGLDCVDGEVFGFDTVRLKENNTRLQFDDTSTSAGFATNNWQIRANAQGSGGGSFLGFVDQGATGNSETGTIVFEVDAGAPANSLRVSSSGRIGNKTATPVLEIHSNDTDTPAIRLEQNNTGGFTAQTWDIGANEANFFVRDVTSGSRLPFRIRPGAPTSSLDISAVGNVGINTASPDSLLEVEANQPDAALNLLSTTQFSRVLFRENGAERAAFQFIGSAFATANRRNAMEYFSNFGPVIFYTAAAGAGTERVRIDTAGLVGIGTNAPTHTLSVNGTASKPGGGTWDIFSDERLKNIHGRYTRGLKAVLQMQPLRYEYKRDNALGINSKGEHIGFGAQTIEKIVPEAVSRTDNGYLMVNNDPIIWAMLNAIKEQQAQIVKLQSEVRRLRVASRRRR